MVADLNVHWDIGTDGQPKPHAHVMLTMREIVVGEGGEAGFGAKVRAWNATAQVEQWRERWGIHVNERLAALDIDARIDHRSLDAQGIGLERSEEHTSELQSLMRTSYAVFCLKKQNTTQPTKRHTSKQDNTP